MPISKARCCGVRSPGLTLMQRKAISMQPSRLIPTMPRPTQGFPASAVAQTFTLPATMNYLQSFTFNLSNFFNGNQLFLQAAVYQFDVDRLLGPALFASSLFAGSGNINGSDAFTFGGGASALNLLLAPNVTYALVLSAIPGYNATPDGSTNQVNLGAQDYTGGSLFFAVSTNPADLSAPGGFFSLDGSTDAAFEATFSATSTPEPATLVFVATGFAGVGGIAARRRRKS